MSSKILIVEDDQALRQMYQLRLELEGYNIMTAENGQMGLEAIETQKPDLILLDLMMPVMDGPTMLAHVRSLEIGSDMKVIILTNVSKDEAPKSLRFFHVDRYIVKAHHTPKQITDIVDEVLGNKR